MDKNNSGLFIVAIVACVAVVSIFMLLSGNQQVEVSEDSVVSEESSALVGQAGRFRTTTTIGCEEDNDVQRACVCTTPHRVISDDFDEIIDLVEENPLNMGVLEIIEGSMCEWCTETCYENSQLCFATINFDLTNNKLSLPSSCIT